MAIEIRNMSINSRVVDRAGAKRPKEEDDEDEDSCCDNRNSADAQTKAGAWRSDARRELLEMLELQRER